MMKFFAGMGAAVLCASLLATSSFAAESGLPREVEIRGVEFVLIPEGWFYKTGGRPVASQQPQFLDEHGGGNVKVWLDAFYIGKFEARARHLKAFLNSRDSRYRHTYGGDLVGCTVVQGTAGGYEEVNPQVDAPATHLSWLLADEWARWMGFRLATEFEWEKAARGADQRVFPWGNDYPDDTMVAFETAGACGARGVSDYAKGRSPYGLYNMSGNVREYVADWYNADADQALKDGERNPASPLSGTVKPNVTGDGEERGPWKILKGGRWASRADGIRISSRVYFPPETPFRCNGTRFALDAKTVRAHIDKGTARVIQQ